MEFETQEIRQRLIRDLRLSAEITDIYDSMAKFAAKQLVPGRERSDIYPLVPFLEEQVRVLAAQGMFGLTVSAEDGGAGLSFRELNSALIGLAQHEASFATILLVQSICATLIGKNTSGLARDRILAGIIGGSLCAYPVFHDARDEWPQLRIEKGRLNGKVRNLTLAPIADILIVPALENGRYSLYWVNAKASSVRCGPALLMHGLRQCPQGDVAFYGVGGDDLGRIASEGAAHELLAKMRNLFATSALAVIGGVALGATAYAGNYLHQRYQTGSQLIDKTPLKVMLANLKIAAWEALFAADRLAVFAEEGRLDDELMLPPLIDFKDRVADLMPDAVQMMGGYAYMRDFSQEQRYRDARQLQALFGRSEFLKSDLIVSAMAV